MRCPNCGEQVPGLYRSMTDVLHCGCYHERRGLVHCGNDPELPKLYQESAIIRFWLFVNYGHHGGQA